MSKTVKICIVGRIEKILNILPLAQLWLEAAWVASILGSTLVCVWCSQSRAGKPVSHFLRGKSCFHGPCCLQYLLVALYFSVIQRLIILRGENVKDKSYVILSLKNVVKIISVYFFRLFSIPIYTLFCNLFFHLHWEQIHVCIFAWISILWLCHDVISSLLNILFLIFIIFEKFFYIISSPFIQLW